MIFPGQGSQSPGMQSALAERYPVVASTYAEASEVLGYDLWTLVQDAPAGKLAETTVTQPAMLAAGVAAWRAWEAAGGKRPAQMAGHSLGEYSALVCAGAMEYPDAVRVVKRRAELMQAAVPAASTWATRSPGTATWSRGDAATYSAACSSPRSSPIAPRKATSCFA
jgi:[acyl-carrier-protein] S-malonyltransferase